MPSDKPGTGEIDETPGLAGGPGPSPPGVDDGTPDPRRAAPEPSVPEKEEGPDDERGPERRTRR